MTGVLKRVSFVFISAAGWALLFACAGYLVRIVPSLLSGKSISLEPAATTIFLSCAAIGALLGAFVGGREAKGMGIDATLVNGAAAWIVAGLIAFTCLTLAFAR